MGFLGRHLLRRWVPYAVLVAGLALTAGLTWSVARAARAGDVARFETTADEARHLIEIRLATYIELLRASAALFAVSTEVTPQELAHFTERLEAGARYPGLQGINFTPGIDDAAAPAQRAAMARARDAGAAAASAVDARRTFAIYMPVFRSDNTLTGFVYSVLRGDELLRDALGTQPGLGFRVYDSTREDPATLLHDTPLPAQRSPHERLRAATRVDVAGRPWTLVFEAYQHFGGSSPLLAPAVLVGGIVLTLALFGITRTQFLAWASSVRHAAELRLSEEAQREVGERLRRLVTLEREARAEAQQADRAKDEFLATLSHELRTPLNAMLGWITMLRGGRVREERRAEALDVIERNARTQAQLIEDLLDVSRIITGKVRLELQALTVAPIVHTAIEAMRPVAENKGIVLQAAIAADAPVVMGDSSRLQQIVWNLLSNAIKFTPPGGHVDVALDRDHDAVRLAVRDTGIGIEASFLPHVFERFRQADSSSTRQHSGVGLGLAIVRHLVDLHAGTIEAHSEGRDHGATFVLRLPAASPAALEQTRGGEATGPATLAHVRVLLVEDEQDTREMLDEALMSAGALVIAADSAEAALVALAREEFDVIVSDIGMAGVDGYELMRRVRRLPGERGAVPAVAVTAYARPDDRETALQAGFQAHLTKPVDIDLLVRTMVDVMQNAKGRLHAV